MEIVVFIFAILAILIFKLVILEKEIKELKNLYIRCDERFNEELFILTSVEGKQKKLHVIEVIKILSNVVTSLWEQAKKDKSGVSNLH